MSQYYRYHIKLTEQGRRIRADVSNPQGETINEPSGVCGLSEVPTRIRELVAKVRRGSAGLDEMNELGEALFKALFPGEVASHFRDLLTRASEEGAILRLELDLDEAQLWEVAALPWEFLRAPQTFARAADNLATDPRVVLSRRRGLWSVAQPITLNEPLRVQLVVSAPSELGEVVYAEVEAALEKLADEHPSQIRLLEVLHQPTATALDRVLEERQPHILHFIGHGRTRKRKGGIKWGELALVKESGQADWRRGEQVAALFQTHRPAVVFLQAGESGTIGEKNPFVGVASQIVQRGIPVVVGMQYAVNQIMAATFAEEFYRRLGLFEPVDVAVQKGRRLLLLAEQSRDTRDFAAPVLFMHVKDGRLFTNPNIERAPDRILNSYLDWLIRQHSKLPVAGMPYAKVADEIELDRVYVALRGDPTNPYEREESYLMRNREADEYIAADPDLSPSDKPRVMQRMIAERPFSQRMARRDRQHLYITSDQEKITLGDAFRRERRLVILGEPGSGKTTLVRWLVLKFAQALRQGCAKVEVPIYQVDPSVARDENGPLVNLGPARLPILIKVSEFAEARLEQNGLLLLEFLGQHTWNNEKATYSGDDDKQKGDPIETERLDDLFKSYLREGRAVIILDGLDEITVPRTRQQVVQAVETFIYDWIKRPDVEKKERSIESDPLQEVIEPIELQDLIEPMWQVVEPDLPAKLGGNQLVVTSRIAGYELGRIRGHAAHVTIEEMEDVAIDHFCDAWMLAIYQKSGELPTPELIDLAERQSGLLKQQIHDQNRPGVRELAGNPLLLTTLASIFLNRQGELPEQRARLYQMAIDNLVAVWKLRKPNLNQHEILCVLSPLAAHIHEKRPTGNIEEGELKKLLNAQLPICRCDAQTQTSQDEVENFIKLIREEVGLLAERAEKVYAFLHRTFQEYLAGLYLVRDHDPKTAAESATNEILTRISHPIWREPILLALGHISDSQRWAQDTREQVLWGVLHADDAPERTKELFPWSTLLIAAALPELIVLPDGLATEVTTRLLRSYADRKGLGRFEIMAAQVESAFKRLRRGKLTKAVDQALLEALNHSSQAEWPLATAKLIYRTESYTSDLAFALLNASQHDDASWGWPIDVALRSMAAHDPNLLPATRLKLRHFLRQNKKAAQLVNSDLGWMQLIMAFYGGLAAPKPEPAPSKATAEMDSTSEEKQAPSQEPKLLPYQLSIDHIYRDCSLTSRFHKALQDEKSSAKLVAEMRKVWKRPRRDEDPAEALLALAILGEDIGPILEEARNKPQQQARLTQLASHISRISMTLRDPIQRATKPITSALERLNDQLPVEPLLGLLASLLEMAFDYEGPTSSPIVLLDIMPSDQRYRISAEVISYMLTNQFDDPVYHMAVFLDTSGPKLARHPEQLALALAESYHIQRPCYRPWPLDYLAPRARNETEILIAALDAIEVVPSDMDNFRSWALEELASLIHTNTPQLLSEAIAIALSIEYFTYQQTALERLLQPLRQSQQLAQIIQGKESLEPIERESDSTKNPYLKLRKLYRWLQLHLIEPSPQIIQLAQAIKDPVQRAYGLWLIAPLFSQETYSELFDGALRAAREITNDPDNQVRALVRLLPYQTTLEAQAAILKESLPLVAQISDEKQRAETVVAIKPFFTTFPDLYDQLQKLADSISNKWHRAKAMGLRSPHLLEYKTQLLQLQESQMALWATPLLGLLINDLNHHFELPQETTYLWASLNIPHQRQQAFTALYEQGVSDKLRLTPTAASALDLLIQAEEWDPVYALLPLVERPVLPIIPIVQGWLEHPDETLARHASLLLVEAGILTPEIMPTLLELLEGSDDRTRYRAGLSLYKRDSRFRTSTLGPEMMTLLAEKHLDYRYERFGIVFYWMWEYSIIHNDPAMFDGWLEKLSEHEDHAEETELIVYSIHHVTSDVWHSFAKALREGTEFVQITLLTSLAKILSKKGLSEKHYGEMREILSYLVDSPCDIQERALKALSEIKRPLAEDIEVFERMLANPEVDHEVVLISFGRLARKLRGEDRRRAERILRDWASQAKDEVASVAALSGLVRLWMHREKTKKDHPAFFRRLSEVNRESNPKQLLEAMIRATRDLYWGTYHDSVVAAASALIEQYAKELRDYLFERFQNAMADLDSPDQYTIISIMAGFAERMPDSFANVAADSHEIQQLLIEATRPKNWVLRRAALIALSYLRRVTGEIIDILLDAFLDVEPVQTFALEAVYNFRQINQQILSELTKRLKDPSAAKAYATVQILRALNEANLSEDLRRHIVRALTEAIHDLSSSQREVYVLQGTYGNYSIKHLGRLDEAMFQALAEVAGFQRASA